jgi:hypothetical protein
LSKLVITNIKANYFHTWKEFEIEIPADYGVVVIGGKAGSGKTTIAQIIRWCLLGGQAKDVDPTPKWAKSWNTTSVSITMSQDTFGGTKQRIVLTRNKLKGKNDSILELKLGDKPVEVDQEKIQTILKEITNLKIGNQIADWQGAQDKLWWFYGQSLQKQVLTAFQQDCNVKSWKQRSGADIVSARLEKALTKANKNYDKKVKWTSQEEGQLKDLKTQIKSAEATAKSKDDAFQAAENELTDFQATNPNWTQECDGSKLAEAFEEMSSATSDIADAKPNYEKFRGWLVAGINSSLKAKSWDENIPQQESHEVIESLKVIKSDWTKFGDLPDDAKIVINESSEGEGLHCVNPERGVALGTVNEHNLGSFEDNLTALSENIQKLRDATTKKNGESIGQEGTRKTLAKINAESAKSKIDNELAFFKGQAKLLREKKAKQLGLDESAIQRKVINKLIEITDKAMEVASIEISDKRVERANKILKEMGSKMKIEVLTDEETKQKNLYRVSSTDNKSPLVSDTSDVNPGHKGVIFSALVAAELANSSLTVPPIWDDSIAVSDKDQIMEVIAGLQKWAVQTNRQAWVISNRPDLEECSKIVCRVVEMTTPSDDYKQRNNDDWRLVG